jgi:leader peptidase (prepilin peptidase)/N-methyltransferase
MASTQPRETPAGAEPPTDNAPERTPKAPTATLPRPVDPCTLLGAAGLSGALVAVYALVPDRRLHALLLILTVATFSWVLTRIDMRSYLLPNRIVAPLAIFGIVQAAGIGIVAHDPSRALVPVITAAILWGAYTALGLAGMFGLGDAKFAGAIALSVAIYASWFTLYILAIAFMVGALQRIILMLLGRDQSKGRAHGPAIGLAALAVLCASVLLTT